VTPRPSEWERTPRIGVTTYLEQARWGVWDRPAALLPQTYLDAVVESGGIPVLLPPTDADSRPVLDLLDGLVLVGGADLDPAGYGARRQPETREIRPHRDAVETELFRYALDIDLPVLGVCRGGQLLNTALGGTLHQHLPDTIGSDAHLPAPGHFGSVRIELASGSLAARALGASATVSCHHHQAIDRLGSDLIPVAWAADRTVEAVELPGRTFALGVQWHPEEDATRGPLFGALVEAARSRTAAV